MFVNSVMIISAALSWLAVSFLLFLKTFFIIRLHYHMHAVHRSGRPVVAVWFMLVNNSDVWTMHHAFVALILLVWRQEGHQACKKLEWWGTGVVICLERCADLHMAPLMPLPLTVSCFSKIQIGFTFLVPAHLGSPRQRAVKRVCVCVSVCVCVCVWTTHIFMAVKAV